LEELTSQLEVGILLIGKPLHMSGDESRQSEYTRDFADRLARQTALPVVFWDERLTSAEAERMLRETGASLEHKKKSVDRLAAMLLLESYLDFRRASGEMLENETNV
jgi:putative Holliday junction resolvase